jgi:hypothetical protein
VTSFYHIPVVKFVIRLVSDLCFLAVFAVVLGNTAAGAQLHAMAPLLPKVSKTEMLFA